MNSHLHVIDIPVPSVPLVMVVERRYDIGGMNWLRVGSTLVRHIPGSYSAMGILRVTTLKLGGRQCRERV